MEGVPVVGNIDSAARRDCVELRQLCVSRQNNISGG